MPNTISVCVIAKNEEQLIGNSLGSVREIADEIIVVDTGSTDRTAEIAEKSGARIIRHPWDGSYGRARNAYLRAALGDWILVLDGDEAIARRDLTKIKHLVRRRSVIGYRLAVRNYTDDYDLMWNWYPNDRAYPKEEKFSSCPGWMKTRALRLFRNFQGLGYIESSSSHTTPIASLRKHPGRIENRDDVVIHHFQYLKGGGRFISGKQQLRLKGEILHAKRYPQEPYPYLNIAKTLFAEKRDAEAVNYLSRAVKLDPSFYEAHQLRGMIEFENGRLSSAEEHLKRAILIDPNAADAWALLGMVLVEQGRPNVATHALKKAIHLRPQHLLAHNSLGVLYEDQGMYREARQEYQAAIKLHPRFKPAKTNLARLMRTNGKRQRSPVRAAP
jgi:glycosyltransferase involved in cell wall biosynthesis